MSRVSADEISSKLKKLLDEPALLKVHAVTLASFTSSDDVVVFGMEMNTSDRTAISLLEIGIKQARMRVKSSFKH